MAKIELRLSSKVNTDNGKSEILLRLTGGRGIDLFAKSEVYVSPEYFEYYVNRDSCERAGIKVPAKTVSVTKKKAVKLGYTIYNRGRIVVRKRIKTPDVLYHEKQQKRINDLCQKIMNAFEAADKRGIRADWLENTVQLENHPESAEAHETVCKSLVELSEKYIKDKNFCYVNTNTVRVIIRDIMRYQGFVRATDKERKDFVFDIDKVTKNDIKDLFDYLRNESDLAEEFPVIFKKLFASYPVGVRKGLTTITKRGDNTLVKLERNLRTFFKWLKKGGYTDNDPFSGLEIGTEQYGDPYYITIDERNQIADFDFSGCKRLEVQRDIFIFQCFVGCRVSDLMRLTSDNIMREKSDNVESWVLVYVPHKTKNNGETPVKAIVPLHPRAMSLIEKYKGVDGKGRLFPFISAQKYNDYIKEIFSRVGITRKVIIRDSKTGENVFRPINEIASSHLARRTFVGNVYLHVQDPNLIGKMSGHVEGSKAFNRYRNIEVSTLKSIIRGIG